MIDAAFQMRRHEEGIRAQLKKQFENTTEKEIRQTAYWAGRLFEDFDAPKAWIADYYVLGYVDRYASTKGKWIPTLADVTTVTQDRARRFISDGQDMRYTGPDELNE